MKVFWLKMVKLMVAFDFASLTIMKANFAGMVIMKANFAGMVITMRNFDCLIEQMVVVVVDLVFEVRAIALAMIMKIFNL